MPKKSTKTPVLLQHPQQYVHSCMANRLLIEREEGFTLVHFGLVDRSGRLLDRLSCILPEFTLESQKENLVQYSDKIGLPKKKSPSWTPPFEGADKFWTLPVIDFLHVTHWDDNAEICFWSYSRGSVADLEQADVKEKVLMPWGVALLRCGIELQKEFLAGLYEET